MPSDKSHAELVWYSYPPYYHVFIVEVMCNVVDATDDGCFTLRHNII